MSAAFNAPLKPVSTSNSKRDKRTEDTLEHNRQCVAQRFPRSGHQKQRTFSSIAVRRRMEAEHVPWLHGPAIGSG